MTTYQSQNVIIRTVRGAVLWMALWTIVTAIALSRWPVDAGPDMLRVLVALGVQVGAPVRILVYLHARARAGHAPGDTESFLFDVALNASMVIAILIVMMTAI